MNRENMLQKIRALLSKTVDSGCSEHEALAALDKARAMMDAYEVTEHDLQLSAAEKAVLRSEPEGSRDPHHIKAGMAMAIAEFCDCKVWKGTHGLVFCGLQSDAQFATWLIDHLTAFVQSELAKHLMGCIAPKGDRRAIINGFVAGAARRINQRLRDLCAKPQAIVSSNSKALVAIKGQAVAALMKEKGINLGRARRSRRTVDPNSFAAGAAAGERASFGRPVSGPIGAKRLT